MKNLKLCFVEIFSRTCEGFFYDYVVIVMSSLHKTQSLRVLFSPAVIYHSLLVTNSTKTKNKVNKLMSLF